MEIFETVAENNFAVRLAAHLRSDYADSVVRRTDKESAVNELSEEDLVSLVKICISRARSFGLTFESSISAFTALMFDGAPNFYRHPVCKSKLEDEEIPVNDRVSEILDALSEEDWESISKDYDRAAWNADFEDLPEDDGSNAKDDADNTDLRATVMNAPRPDSETKAEKLPETDFAQTVANMEKPKSIPKQTEKEDLSFLDTVINIDKE